MILDEVRLAPDGLPSPPGRAVTAAATAGAIVAAVIVLVGVPAPWAVGLLAGFAVAQGLALSIGAAPYARLYLAAVPRIAGGAGILALIVAGAAVVVQRKALSATAATAVAITASPWCSASKGCSIRASRTSTRCSTRTSSMTCSPAATSSPSRCPRASSSPTRSASTSPPRRGPG